MIAINSLALNQHKFTTAIDLVIVSFLNTALVY